jgi:hypothetical protein
MRHKISEMMKEGTQIFFLSVNRNSANSWARSTIANPKTSLVLREVLKKWVRKS